MQNRAGEVAKCLLEEKHPSEAFKAEGLGQIELGHGARFDFLEQIRRVIRDAHKAQWALRIPSDHAVELVDIFGAVASAPFEANDGLRVSGLGHGVGRGSCSRKWGRVNPIGKRVCLMRVMRSNRDGRGYTPLCTALFSWLGASKGLRFPSHCVLGDVR